ncbi:MAG: hypothetical protein ABJC66_08130 [Gammaproteobacteria bacterium]
MRLLWSLPKAAPALLRHFAAYVDLASLDLARASQEFAAEFVASAIIAVCVLFALLMGCLVVVACTWDTHYRVAAIAWMAGAFSVGAVAAAVYRSSVVRKKLRMLNSVRTQWQEDRVLLEGILASSDQD